MTSKEEDEINSRIIGDPPSPSGPKSNPMLLSFLLKFLVMTLVIFLFFLFIGIATVFLIHILVGARVLHRRRHCDRTSHRYCHRITTSYVSAPFDYSVDCRDSGFSPTDLQKLRCFTVAESASTQDCAVCLEGLREGERYRILPGCKHLFHYTCIDTWLSKASACPICRGIVELKE